MLETYRPREDILQSTTLWSFPDRGDWATHNNKYRGNWSPYIPRNIIKRYSKVGDMVLDPFVGGGTTLIEAKLLNRNAIGIDINPEAIKITKQNLNFKYKTSSRIYLLCRNANNLDFIKNNSIDLICTHPPYANMIKYSKNIEGDISLCSPDDFLMQLKIVVHELYRVLKANKYCAFLMGDIRKNKNIIPLGFMSMKVFQETGFLLKEIVIKEQHNCKSTPKWISKSSQYNFLLIAHEYLFIFQKPDPSICLDKSVLK